MIRLDEGRGNATVAVSHNQYGRLVGLVRRLRRGILPCLLLIGDEPGVQRYR